MGDRGDFEVPEDIYRGGGYRPQVTGPSGAPMSFDDFKNEAPGVRAAVYATFAFALFEDPSSLSQDELLLLGYGLNVDSATTVHTGEQNRTCKKPLMRCLSSRHYSTTQHCISNQL